MRSSARSRAPLILWPIAAIWDLIALVLRVTGRLVGFAIGLVLLVLGGILTITVVFAPIGLPLLAVGFLLMIRSVLTIF